MLLLHTGRAANRLSDKLMTQYDVSPKAVKRIKTRMQAELKRGQKKG